MYVYVCWYRLSSWDVGINRTARSSQDPRTEKKKQKKNGEAGLAPRASPSTNPTATTTWEFEHHSHHRPPPFSAPSMDGLQRRPAAAAANARGEGAQQPQRVIHCDVEPAPRAWPGMQMLALAAILVLGGLQFLPATHFRHPADRGHNWIPFDPSRHAAVRPSAAAACCRVSPCSYPCLLISPHLNSTVQTMASLALIQAAVITIFMVFFNCCTHEKCTSFPGWGYLVDANWPVSHGF